MKKIILSLFLLSVSLQMYATRFSPDIFLDREDLILFRILQLEEIKNEAVKLKKALSGNSENLSEEEKKDKVKSFFEKYKNALLVPGQFDNIEQFIDLVGKNIIKLNLLNSELTFTSLSLCRCVTPNPPNHC